MPSVSTDDYPKALMQVLCGLVQLTSFAITVILTLTLTLANSASAQVLSFGIQKSPLAGAQFHQLAAVMADIRVGDRLVLARESSNRHDQYAVKVSWHETPLGYLPRAQNRAIAEAMDNGIPTEGRVAVIQQSADPWQRLLIDVWVTPNASAAGHQ